ncbi:MAG TPA: polysaccharide biosynthesis C-terminal domain-containing protein, partial [Candidatus Saccharimonadales bacterium]|nr:polysaccharide biosynthesis C-terminal domain-containing protein [Candidatus Saccharimonadales bacterium]
LLLWLTIVLNKEKFLPFIYGFAAVVNLSLNLYLVPKYGYNSAAWVTLLSELIIMLLLLLVLYYESFTTTKNSAK